MEQQTISIAKAGVRATLNARTSILAAANPNGGRYDRSKSLQLNVNLSAPIMSRFDLFFILVDECNEVIDYAIARKIVDLHSNITEGVDVKYTTEEVLQYITFARRFKPIISKEAADVLVRNYNNLRVRDSSGTSRSTWRITVRQLESMIRLSEAMARLEISDIVYPRHVNEAYRLLNKSIIRVEQPDIHLDGDQDEPAPREIDELPAENGEENTTNGQENEPVRKKLTLSFEEYKNLSNMIIIYMRKEETSQGEENYEGIRRSHVVGWYLKLIEDQLETEDDLIEKKEMMEKVIDRLIFHVSILFT